MSFPAHLDNAAVSPIPPNRFGGCLGVVSDERDGVCSVTWYRFVGKVAYERGRTMTPASRLRVVARDFWWGPAEPALPF